jgi:aerobic carbon-monoxide dehydrogenase medium subunit
MTILSRPTSFAEAARILADLGPSARLVAGGTDLYVKLRKGLPPPEYLVDLGSVADPGARSIAEEGGEKGSIRAGALVNFAQVVRSPLVAATLPALRDAASIMGSVQIRGRGTLGGNAANASPGGDALPPLIVGNARAIVVSSEGSRTVSVEDLFVGPGLSCLAPHEIIVSFVWPRAPGRASVFERVGNRAFHVITKASAAIAARFDDTGRICDVGVALGAVAPTPIRARRAEMVLEGTRPSVDLLALAASEALSECAPKDDIRSTVAYRAEMCRVLLPRLLRRLDSSWRAGCDVSS